jgi:histidyl-tRNA synthetase
LIKTEKKAATELLSRNRSYYELEDMKLLSLPIQINYSFHFYAIHLTRNHGMEYYSGKEIFEASHTDLNSKLHQNR